MKLSKVDSLQYVREHPEIFLRFNELQLHELATKLVTDAISLGVFPVSVDFSDDWWMVSSKKNWLKIATDLPIDELFRRLVANPRAGRNACRSEIILYAYVDNIILLYEGETHIIKGNLDSSIEKYFLKNSNNSFIFAFK